MVFGYAGPMPGIIKLALICSILAVMLFILSVFMEKEELAMTGAIFLLGGLTSFLISLVTLA